MPYNKLSPGSTPKSSTFLKPFKFIQRQFFSPATSAITAKEVPKWKWSLREFHTWLVEYMVEKGRADRGEVVDIALRYYDRLEGEMYYLSKGKRQDILGHDMGKLIHKRLQKIKFRDGTTPAVAMDEEGNVRWIDFTHLTNASFHYIARASSYKIVFMFFSAKGTQRALRGKDFVHNIIIKSILIKLNINYISLFLFKI
jgi:hypothetical protein